MKFVSNTIRKIFKKWIKAKGRLPLPVRLRHRRLYILPNRYGLIFFAILLAILIGSINHNNNLGFILTFLLGGMSFISIFHTFRNLNGVTVTSVRAKPVFAGQPAMVKVVLTNPGQQRWAISLVFTEADPMLIDLAAGERQTITIPHATAERGLHCPAPLTIATTYPLGLFRCWSPLYVDVRFLIYPKPLPGPTITDTGLTEHDSEGESGGPGVEDFAGLKTYTPGDQLQHISWKSFSRGQGLQTKVFEGMLGRSVYFDLNGLPGHDLEWKLSRLCHMIIRADSLRQSYGLKLGSQVIEPGMGGGHKRNCLRLLALTSTGEK